MTRSATKTGPRARNKKPPYPDPNAHPPEAGDGNGEPERLPTEGPPKRVDGRAGRDVPFGQPDEEQRALPFEPPEAAGHGESPLSATFTVETPAELPAGRIEAIPLGPLPPDAWLPRHVDCQLRTPEQRENLKRISIGLDQAGARLKSGQRVTNYAEAIRWLLERIEQ